MPQCRDAKRMHARATQDAAKGRGTVPEPPAEAAAASTSTPTSTGGVSVWSLVKRTRAHPKYAANYDSLPSYTPGWTRVKRWG